MALYFITGNDDKFREASAVLPRLQRLAVNLPEIQSDDAQEIIEAKLKEACRRGKDRYVVEDTSLCLDCMSGLPGPLVKWFLKALGRRGMHDVAKLKGKYGATAQAMVGYAHGPDDFHYFKGEVRGRIVEPRGDSDFGWDPIFLPDGHDRTFGEMPLEEKNAISHRRMALEGLKEFIER